MPTNYEFAMHTDGQLAERLMFYSKPKLLIIDELGDLPFERVCPICATRRVTD